MLILNYKKKILNGHFIYLLDIIGNIMFLTFYSNEIIPNFNGIVLKSNFIIDQFSNDLFQDLNIELPFDLINATDKRKSEFLAGRILAKNILNRFNIKNYSVDRHPSGKPIWPNGISGSISHYENKVICVITKKSLFYEVGIDITAYMNKDLINDIISIILDQEEICYIRSLPYNLALIVSTIFSAKESIFKAFYSRIGTYFDFLDVAIIKFTQNFIYFIFKKDLSIYFKKNMIIKVYYYWHEDHLITFTESI